MMTRAIASASLLLLVGCATPKATFQSTVARQGASRIRRLFVYTNVEGRLPAPAYAPFAERLMQELSQCQITTRVLEADHANPERDRIALRAMRAFEADAVLLVKCTKGAGEFWEGDALDFDFQLMDVLADRAVWTAQSQASIGASGAGAGAYAAAVVEQLRKDGVVGCPAGSGAGSR